jgi:hypothetical protein
VYVYNWWLSLFKEYLSYHYITSQGDQVSVSTSDVVYNLVIHHTRQGKFYKIVPFSSEDTSFIPSLSFIGLSVCIHNKSYVISPQEFLLTSNILFTPCFNLWLCKHYLYRKYGKVEWTILDDSVMLHQGSSICVNNELKNDIK